VGPTLTAILGALEPLTALVLGIAFLGEALTMRLAVGATLVIGAVTFWILRPVRG
jgi:drug/metabolite transporter (DMT)-like permease